MDADDRTGPRQWSTSSPEDLDRLARGVLRAARDAAWELRREPPDPDRRTWALGVLAGQTQAMLGPGMPDHPPIGDAAQEGCVRTALALALHVRAHSWAEKDLGVAGVPGQDDVPHPGERQAADAFDVLGRLMLPDASPEGWTATLVTDMARGDNTLEAAVKLGKYILHPTFLALTDDATRVVGEALHNINVRRLHELTRLLRHYSDPGPAHPARGQVPTPAVGKPAPNPYSQPGTQSESPGSKFDDPLPVYPPHHYRITTSPDRLTPERRRPILGRVRGGLVLAESLVALAAAAGAAVVQAVGTDAWAGLRSRVAAWIGGGDLLQEGSELERLDRTAGELIAAGDGQAERLRVRHKSIWQTRIEDLLEGLSEPEQQQAAAQLKALLEEHASAVRSSGRASAPGEGVAPERDITITAEGGSVAAYAMHGNASLGPADPVVGIRPLPLFWSSRHLPPVKVGQALVLATTQGTYDMYVRPGRPRFRDAAGRRYTSVYAVDLREHLMRLDLVLPGPQETASFTAAFTLVWRVSDPVAWVTSGPGDVAALLEVEVQRLARPVSRRFDLENSAGLQQDLARRIRQMELAGVGLTVRGDVWVQPEHPAARVEEHRLETLREDLDNERRLHLLKLLVEHQESTVVLRLLAEGHLSAEETARMVDRLRRGSDGAAGTVDDEESQSFYGPLSVPPVAGASDEEEPRRLVAQLAEQAPPGREVPLQVRITRGDGDRGVALQAFVLPAGGARLLIAVHAPGLLALGDLQQEVIVEAGRDSDVLLFRLRTMRPGLHTVTVRAFRGGSFLGELLVQISVEEGVPARDGPPWTAPLDSLAMDPGEVTLQVLKGADGTYSFQLLSETSYAPEAFHVRAGDPRQATEDIYRELRNIAAAAGDGADAAEARERLRDLGVSLWRAAVPEAVRRQFWQETGRIRAFTVLGEQDLIPWELLYPLDGTEEGDGFLAEWLPVVRRVFGQDRVRQLDLPQATFVVPPGSPPEADREVTALRARFGPAMAYGGTLTGRAQVRSVIRGGMAGLLHFACHNVFTDTGSRVVMADGDFSPRDLSYAQGAGTLRATRPLVFFNACRSAGQIDWYSTSLGWAPQFLEAGAGAFIGTLWPVRSDSALAYADAFYRYLVTDGLPLGEASMEARRAIRDYGGDPTWLAYAVYGSPAARATTT